jgi:hypothetical protein
MYETKQVVSLLLPYIFGSGDHMESTAGEIAATITDWEQAYSIRQDTQ